jgi:hypothetical protein
VQVAGVRQLKCMSAKKKEGEREFIYEERYSIMIRNTANIAQPKP